MDACIDDRMVGAEVYAWLVGIDVRTTVPLPTELETSPSPPMAFIRWMVEARPMWPSLRATSWRPAGIPTPSSATSRLIMPPLRSTLTEQREACACLATLVTSSRAADRTSSSWMPDALGSTRTVYRNPPG